MKLEDDGEDEAEKLIKRKKESLTVKMTAESGSQAGKK